MSTEASNSMASFEKWWSPVAIRISNMGRQELCDGIYPLMREAWNAALSSRHRELPEKPKPRLGPVVGAVITTESAEAYFDALEARIAQRDEENAELRKRCISLLSEARQIEVRAEAAEASLTKPSDAPWKVTWRVDWGYGNGILRTDIVSSDSDESLARERYKIVSEHPGLNWKEICLVKITTTEEVISHQNKKEGA